MVAAIRAPKILWRFGDMLKRRFKYKRATGRLDGSYMAGRGPGCGHPNYVRLRAPDTEDT